MEVGRLVENQTVPVSKDVCREPSVQSQASCAYDGRKSALHECLSGLEVLACYRHFCLLCQFPHSWYIYRRVWCSHDEWSTFGKCCIGIAHGGSHMLPIVSFHCCFELLESSVHAFAVRYIDFRGSSPCHNDTATSRLSLELPYVLSDSLCHLPPCLAILYVVSVKTLGIVLVKSCLHRHYLLQFLPYWFNVLFL